MTKKRINDYDEYLNRPETYYKNNYAGSDADERLY